MVAGHRISRPTACKSLIATIEPIGEKSAYTLKFYATPWRAFKFGEAFGKELVAL
jgi:hypothetical protein